MQQKPWMNIKFYVIGDRVGIDVAFNRGVG